MFEKRTLTYFVRGSITMQLTDLLFDRFRFDQTNEYVSLGIQKIPLAVAALFQIAFSTIVGCLCQVLLDYATLCSTFYPFYLSNILFWNFQFTLKNLERKAVCSAPQLFVQTFWQTFWNIWPRASPFTSFEFWCQKTIVKTTPFITMKGLGMGNGRLG